MGVEHFIVDVEGRNVLDCHKSYWLPDAGPVTLHDLRIAAEEAAANEARGAWTAERVVAWVDLIASGRPLRIATDAGDDDDLWADWSQRGPYPPLRPGWTGWTCTQIDGKSDRPGWRWWSDDTVATATRIRDSEFWRAYHSMLNEAATALEMSGSPNWPEALERMRLASRTGILKGEAVLVQPEGEHWRITSAEHGLPQTVHLYQEDGALDHAIRSALERARGR
jgi:hypothetical protein